MMIIMSCLLCFEFITMTRTTDISMSKLGQKYKVKICNLFVQIIIIAKFCFNYILFNKMDNVTTNTTIMIISKD